MGRGQAKRGRIEAVHVLFLLVAGMVIAACSLQGGMYASEEVSTSRPLSPSETPGIVYTATAAVTIPPATPTPGPGTDFVNDNYSQTSYLIPLTVQFCSADSAVVYFELEQPASGFLFYRQESVPLSEASYLPLDAGEPLHLLSINGLQPDTNYRFDVGLWAEDGKFYPPAFRGERWGTISLRTLPENIEQLRIGIISDAGFGDEITYQLITKMAESDLDFVIYTGDVVTSMEEQPGDPFLAYWLKFYQNFKPVLEQMPIYPVPGNHEYDFAARWMELPFYFHAFPAHPGIDPMQQGFDGNRHWYALEFGDVQFLMLDSETIYGAPGRAEMQAWLGERLKDDRFGVTIPVHHIPPFTSGIYTEEGIPFQQLWHPLYVEAGVPLVISGHDHNYQRLYVDGITYLVSGGGSSITYAIDELLPQNQYARRISHYVVLEVGPDSMELRAISYKGEQIDQTVIPLE